MNYINIELCAEDRARLDRLAAALEALQPLVAHLALPTHTPRTKKADPEQLTAEDTSTAPPAENPENVPEAAENETATTEHPAAESLPWEEPTPEAEAKPPVTLEQIQQKVIELAAGNNGAKKAKVREIVNAYAKKVSDLPVDKWDEVWAKLTALESEA